MSNQYRAISKTPLMTSPLLKIDTLSGDVISSVGSGLFYMPHGLTVRLLISFFGCKKDYSDIFDLEVDLNGDLWVTDVGKHQVRRYLLMFFWMIFEIF